ncbi:MAG: hypothetical protein R3F17_09065 [Planctomycetota bacterium]
MNIAVVTSLYPTPAKPFEGVFAERRWTAMAAAGHSVRVIYPLPMAPLPIGRFAAIAKTPAHQRRGPIAVDHPRYLHLPRNARGNAQRFAKVALRMLRANLAGRRGVRLRLAGVGARHCCALCTQGALHYQRPRKRRLQVAGAPGWGRSWRRICAPAPVGSGVELDLVHTMDRLAADGRQGT